MHTLFLHHDKIREILQHNLNNFVKFTIEVDYPENDFFVYSYIKCLVVETTIQDDSLEQQFNNHLDTKLNKAIHQQSINKQTINKQQFSRFVESYLNLPIDTIESEFIIRRQYIRDFSFTVDVLEFIKIHINSIDDNISTKLQHNNCEKMACCIL